MTHVPLSEQLALLPRQVKETRERRGLTIQGAAKAIGIPRGALTRIEASTDRESKGAVTVAHLRAAAAWLD